MANIEKGELKVPAIKDGSVIDHIPVEKVEPVVRLLDLFDLPYPITIGRNFRSRKLERKGIIKVEKKHFTPEEVNKLALVAPEVVINVIKDYEVVKKINVSLPDRLHSIVKCPNPKCITNNEPMESDFSVLDKKKGILQCKYCNRKIERGEVKLK
ncbi:aspartate carbamoyltransferase regulatory subunit [Porphyromonadaceae bacterium W3.11]|nr:aspartate carbamoyltransferase regulatory subunit [Porphyromonadaceae bacterium W3.11]